MFNRVWLSAVVVMPDLPITTLSLALSYTLGLMGILTPYATGSAPLYYGSGYISHRDVWMLGLGFGLPRGHARAWGAVPCDAVPLNGSRFRLHDAFGGHGGSKAAATAQTALERTGDRCDCAPCRLAHGPPACRRRASDGTLGRACLTTRRYCHASARVTALQRRDPVAFQPGI